MACLSEYARLNLVVFSGSMTVKPHPVDGYKKDFAFPSEWQKLTKSSIDRRASGHAMRTGSDVGIFGIDIDDPELPHNQELMDLMVNCNMKQKTKKGFHYIYKWDPRIKQSTSKELALDTRANGGCLFVAPSCARAPDGSIIASYEWLRLPEEDNEINAVPEEVIEYLKKFGNIYIDAPKEDILSEPTNTDTDRDGDVNVLFKVLDGLNVKRFDDYDSWLKIGIVCHNEGLPLTVWDTFSQKSDGYEVGACGKKWLTFKEKSVRLTEATLWFWLKQDNPTLFYSLMEERESTWKLIELLNNNDIAKYFYSCNSDAYIWSEKLGWYSLQWNNTWKRSENGQPPGLKSKISDSLQVLFMDIKKTELQKYANVAGKTTDRDIQDKLLKEHTTKIRMISKAYVDLGKSDFCNGVISFLQSLYAVDNLEQTMDMNINLMAFTDGVFDCSKCKFRPIAPKDYISITTGYVYPKKSCTDIRKELKNMLHGMFECEEVEKHLLRVLASCLYGNNRWEQFYVLTGNGGNGKGMINTLLRRVFGNYHYEVNMNMFTKTSDKKDPIVPELVEARNKRILMASESEKHDVLQIGFLKGISGNDVISARTLYSGYVHKYIAPFKLILQCNTIPKLSKLDDAIKRRMIVIDFPFQFRESSKMNDGIEPHMNRLQNPDMKVACNSRDDWRDEFLLMLTECYKEIKDLKELPVPDKVKDATNKYLDTNNPLKEWLANHYEITREEAHIVMSAELKRNFHYDTKIEKMDDHTFKDLLGMNGISSKKTKNGCAYWGLIRRKEETPVILIQ